MSYIHEVIRLAKQLDSQFTVDYDREKHRYEVRIINVFFKEKNSYLKLDIVGLGFTIEDAAYDYMRKCRGDKLVHVITDKEISPL